MRTLLAGLVLASSLGASFASGSTVVVGVAKVDITPDFPVLMQGYASRKGESKSVAGRLWAKAIAFGSDAEGASVLITVDNLGIPEALAAEVADRLKAKAGIPRERVTIGASHTHSAPMVEGCAPNIFGRDLKPEEREHVGRYTRIFVGGLEAAALAALEDRAPAELSHGAGSVDFAVNRRAIKDGRWSGFGEVPAGPVDHALPVLRAADASGKVRAILANYACHCTTLSPDDNTIHGDWAGFAQEMMEADHPGSIALTLIGCGADANPKNRSGAAPGASLEVARKHARALADEVKRVLAAPMKSLSVPPAPSMTRVKLPFESLPTRAALEDMKTKGDAHARANAAIQIAKIERLGALPEAIDYPIQSWRFGDDLCLVFLAGEVVVDYVLRIKEEFDPGRVWVVSYANDAPCYIPSDRILGEGGYEAEGSMVYYAWPSRLKGGAEGIILGAVRTLVPATFKRP